MDGDEKMISRYGKIVSRETLFNSAYEQYNYEPEEMHYTVLKYSNNELHGYLSFSYTDLKEHFEDIINFFKKSNGYTEFLVLELETGRMIELSMLEKKKVELATKYGVLG